MKPKHLLTAALLVCLMTAAAIPAAAQSYRLDKPTASLAPGTLI